MDCHPTISLLGVPAKRRDGKIVKSSLCVGVCVRDSSFFLYISFGIHL